MDYSDVTFNLTDSSYHPFNKTNNETNYKHKKLKDPTAIINLLPLFVERRLSKLLLNQKTFNDSILIYQKALIKAGYNHKLTYQKQDQNKDSNTKDKSFGLTPNKVKMLPRKLANFS